MEVFVGNLAGSVTLLDLNRLFKDFKHPPIQLMEKKQSDGSLLRYAVVDFDAPRLAQKAIKKLHGAPLNGCELVLHEYTHRSYTNERRAIDWRTRPWDGLERRRSERRKPLAAKNPVDDFPQVEVESVDEPTAERIRIEGYRGLARKL